MAVATRASEPFLFTGREWDGSTGLQFNRARYYNPTFGRFVAEDPIGIGAGDPNLYLYGANSPTNLTDPLGLEPQEDDCGFLGIGCIDDLFQDHPWVGFALTLALDSVAVMAAEVEAPIANDLVSASGEKPSDIR